MGAIMCRVVTCTAAVAVRPDLHHGRAGGQQHPLPRRRLPAPDPAAASAAATAPTPRRTGTLLAGGWYLRKTAIYRQRGPGGELRRPR